MNPPTKKRWQRVDGVLLLDKPEGMSSNAALQRARRLFSAEKAGHTGTLDPFATGLLPLCFGEATKFSADLLAADKTYEAEALLGITTDTGDSEGAITATQTVMATAADVAAVLPRFTGDIQQIPPMYSALKREGQPLYKLARAGKMVEREARVITIHALELLAFALPRLRFRVRCSKGTYIRALAEDLGKALGCGAHLVALRRTGVGDLTLETARSLSELEHLPEAERPQRLAPVDHLIASLPAVVLGTSAAQRFCHGNPVSPPLAEGLALSGKIRAYAENLSPENLLGVGTLHPDGLLWPQRLLATPLPHPG
ncbi:MAG: tRNA pseudouridine(55) synthase TruB [Zoogloeaceae bacterium]|jgi:tRNA pseudouridine55 synthase|nr:tRNA pseudouridine(55) synthase TruB [Zoogloeaceae bacterium]